MDPQARTPRAIVTVNGTRVAYLNIDINNNGNYQADTFRVTCPVTKSQPNGVNRDWWGSQSQMEVEIFFGFPSSNDYTQGDLVSMFLGAVDLPSDDMVTDVITLTGRDYTSTLIDTKTTMKWSDRRASDVIKIIATDHGLGYSVVPTNTKIGSYYKHNQTKMSVDTTEWDLCTWLAKEEGYQVYVDHKVLHFEPISTPTVWPFKYEGGVIRSFPGTRLKFDRNLTLAKDITVKVLSFDPNSGKRVVGEAKATHTKDKILRQTQMNLGQPQIFSYKFRGLTKVKADKKAAEILANISHHQIKMTLEGVPADTILTPRNIIRVTGTGPYDQDYRPDWIIRKFSMDEGFTMDIIAKNHDTNTTVIL